ncbi:hypothetical protein [Haloarcula litorea]|uniref:hypothetical protein n=1 Tax=Haloarcula litorea TaxID=3032579 RepID=UPI0023E7CC3B|nr:hypothetical protein [Halomicroarcula sp. GDY20]
MADDAYRLLVKPSARRVSARAGRWVNRRGPARTFPSKALAREWARACRGPSALVWVQDAPAWADDGADGYLVGRPPRQRREPTGDARQQRLGEAER